MVSHQSGINFAQLCLTGLKNHSGTSMRLPILMAPDAYFRLPFQPAKTKRTFALYD